MHSLTDWDFLYREDWSAFGRYDLYTRFYVSPPSCLRFDAWPLDSWHFALCNLAPTLNMKAGRLTTWARSQAPGPINPYIFIGVTGPGINGIVLSVPQIYNSFNRNRWDWWQGYDEHNDPATLVSWYKWFEEAWLFMGLYTYPPMIGAVNRVGIGQNGGGLGADKYWDDTEIWVPI